ncbi:hypothetical protein BD626DRAFT_483371 [Schizophyllum amplum]|uniref:Small ribosomal subunit protein uS10m n=1 Tax=Schizophyllum amplum TaxID=97359 RepID=A0A550CPC1_9AGAR|nr:hypothetical protein BD626DRAFT_483371 [Auriculariopsis ampla]
MLSVLLSRAPRTAAARLRTTNVLCRHYAKPSNRPDELEELMRQNQQHPSKKRQPLVADDEVADMRKADEDFSAHVEASVDKMLKNADSSVPDPVDLTAPDRMGNNEVEIFGRTDFPSSLDATPRSPTPSDFLPERFRDPRHLPIRVTRAFWRAPFTELEYAAAYVPGRSIQQAFSHPRPHRVPVASIQFAGHDPRQLELFTHFATHVAYSLGIPCSRPARLPTQRSMWTVIKSPFVHKKSQENFERKTHKRVIKAWDADGEVVRRWAAYLRKHAMGGVGMRVVMWDRLALHPEASAQTLTNGKLEDLEASRRETPREKIRALGEEILREELKSGAQVESSAKLL